MISSGHCHSQFIFSASCYTSCKSRPNGNAHSVFSLIPTAAKLCGPSPITPRLMTTNTTLTTIPTSCDNYAYLARRFLEVDVLHISIGCRFGFALDIITISQQQSPTPDLEPPVLDAELEPLLWGLVPHPPYCGHDGQITWTAPVERHSHSNCTLCCQTMRLHSDDSIHLDFHHSRTVPFLWLQFQPTSQLYHCLRDLRWLQHWLTHCSHSRASCYRK